MKLVWQAEDVMRAVRGQCLHMQDWTAHGVTIDSRTTGAGDLFVAIKGDSLDGHTYVHKAFDAGAVAAIVDRQPPQVPPDAPLIFVDDTFTALQDLGRVGRARSSARIIAVTGSVGKTSSKEQLRLMLGAVDDTCANEGSLNNHWGVPLSLARLPVEAKYGIFEIGMNHVGELGPLSREVRPHVALITNVEAVHLEHFSSTEEIANAKAEIFLGMDPAGLAILNRDNPHYARLLAAARTQGLKKTLCFGTESKCDAHALRMTCDETGTTVDASILGKPLTFRVGTPGQHLAFNALGTLLTCAAAEADITICAEALAGYRPPLGRGTRQSVSLSDTESFTLIDESFNASPVATQAAITVLGQTPVETGGRRIAVLGDMRELGQTGPALHEELSVSLIKNKIDVVHCCGELMKHLYETLPRAMRGQHTANSQDLAPFIVQDVRARDVVMVKGSHSMHLEIVVEALRNSSAQPPSTHKRAS